MTFYVENLKPLSIAVLKYIENLSIQDRCKFCNLKTEIINNKNAKAYWIAGAICKHYIIDKQEKIYIVYPNVEKYIAIENLKAKHISQLNKFSQFTQLGRLIKKYCKL